jgi:hypothetical protein
VHPTICLLLHRLRPIHPSCLIVMVILNAVIIGFVIRGNAGLKTQAEPASQAIPASGPDGHLPGNPAISPDGDSDTAPVAPVIPT